MTELGYHPPLDWPDVVAYFGPRVVPGVEHIDERVYRRNFSLGGRTGVLELAPLDARPALVLTVTGAIEAEPEIAARLRRQLDLDADPAAVLEHLRADPELSPHIGAVTAPRLFGGFDPFELAVRAVLGQQVSVSAAGKLTARLVERWGEPAPASRGGRGEPELPYHFPSPAALAEADVASLGMPGARGRTVNALARALCERPDFLDRGSSLDDDVARLCSLPGIGPWTANYVAIRAMRHTDAFPAADIGLLRAMARGGKRPTPGELEQRSQRWRPYRAYAAMALWGSPAGSGG